MQIKSEIVQGRKVWNLDNDAAVLTVMEGGGHIAGLRVKAVPRVNPYWAPVWKGLEPWKYRKTDAKRYGVQLLAAIRGHNLCLSAFGSPSPEEERAGFGNHGEAPVLRWKVLRKKVSRTGLAFTFGCAMPIAQMSIERTITARRGSAIFRVRERVRNLARRDVPFTMCEHVTFGPPFLEKGVTVFDMPATRSRTFPGEFGTVQRMKPDTEFAWPAGPGAKGGKVDLRTIGAQVRRSSDFSTQLIDPKRSTAWFSAVNPRQGLLVAYVWKRSDFPWVGNWEENHGRAAAPWNGKSLTRGMEFSNAPLPVGLRQAVTMGKMFGVPTYAWLPARATATMDFSIIGIPVMAKCKGVGDIRPMGSGFEVKLKGEG